MIDPSRFFDRNGPLARVLTGYEERPAQRKLAQAVAEVLDAGGIAAQVVSMPSWDRFEEQSSAFKSEIFPTGIPVLSVEAGVTFGWSAYADDSIGIDRFGASAPGNLVLDKLGINVDHVVARATDIVNRTTTK